MCRRFNSCQHHHNRPFTYVEGRLLFYVARLLHFLSVREVTYSATKPWSQRFGEKVSQIHEKILFLADFLRAYSGKQTHSLWVFGSGKPLPEVLQRPIG